jgi:hypothetical protein
VKIVIIQSRKTMAEPKASPKKTTPIEPDEEEGEVEVEAKLGPEMEVVDLGKASPRDVSDTLLMSLSNPTQLDRSG